MESKLLLLGTSFEITDIKEPLPREDDAVFFIEKGDVDLYVRQIMDHQEFKTYITTRRKGELLFSFFLDNPEHEIIALPSEEIKIRKISLSTLNKALENDPLLREEFELQLNSWVVQVYESLAPLLNEDIHTFFEMKKDLVFRKKNELISPLFPHKLNQEAGWVKVDQGHLFPLDQKTFSLNSDAPYFPACARSYFTVGEETHLEMISTKQLIEKGLWFQSTVFFQAFFARYLLVMLNAKKKREKERIEKKKTLDEVFLDESLEKLTTFFEKEKISDVNLQLPALYQACQILQNHSDLHFIFPSKEKKNKKMEWILSELCNNSSLRFRKVRLLGDWYKQDNGPLLGFIDEERFPVALIYKKNHYEVNFPNTLKALKLDQKEASRLSQEAFMFYSSFPEKKLSGKSLFSFCFKGKSKEIWNMALLGLASVFLALYVPFANSVIFNRIIPLLDNSLLYQVAAGLLIVAISSAIFSFISSFAMLRLQMEGNNRLQAGIWDRILRLPVSFFRQFTTGDLIKRVFALAELRSLISNNFLSAVITGAFSFLYLAMMFYFSATLALLGLGIATVGSLVVVIFLRYKIQVEEKMLIQQGIMNGFIYQVLSGIEKIRTTASENILFSKWTEQYFKTKQKNLSSKSISNFMETWMALLPLLGMVTVFGSAIVLLKKNEGLSVGDFIAFNAAYGSFTAAIYTALSLSINYMGLIIPRWKRTKIILESLPEIREHKIDPGSLQGFVEIDNVFFRYSEKSPLILNGVTIKASPGEFIAIVGPSGCGKSTLISLLLQFNQPTSGSIFIDGKSLVDLDIMKVRRQLGVVLQDSDVLAGTILDNLSPGGIFTREEILTACQLSGFDRTLEEFPMGLETFLTDNGKNLSGGQKQQLLITRALMGNPRILLFDEATGALDNKSQQKVFESLEKLKITRIVIAHRLSTIAHADRIYLLAGGKIAEQGTYESLANAGGVFASWVKKQML